MKRLTFSHCSSVSKTSRRPDIDGPLSISGVTYPRELTKDQHFRVLKLALLSFSLDAHLGSSDVLVG
jgi:hypothetical protein